MAENCSTKASLGNEISVLEEGTNTISPPREYSTDQNIIVSPIISQKIIAELVGTYVIILMGCGSVIIDKRFGLTIIGIAVSWGLVVMVMIYTFGHISGAHFNPAVTIAFAASRKFPWKQVPVFVASQLVGSTLAVRTLVLMFNHPGEILCTVTRYTTQISDLEALGWEFIISFILMLTICGVATDSRAINELSGVAVGATVLINVIIAGKMTGASMNPARSIGPAIVAWEFGSLWVYIVAPILGTMMACMIYSLLRLPVVRHEQNGDNNPKRVY